MKYSIVLSAFSVAVQSAAALPERDCGGSGNGGGGCADLTINGNAWYDSDGPDFDCATYVEENICDEYGDAFRNVHTANEACCGCGGGRLSTTSETIITYGECSDIMIQDSEGNENWNWYTGSVRQNFDCAWFAESDDSSSFDRCSLWGGTNESFGYVAQEACCTCGGGTREEIITVVTEGNVIEDPQAAPEGLWELNKDSNERDHNTKFQSRGSAAALVLRRGQSFNINGGNDNGESFALQSLRPGYSKTFELDSVVSSSNIVIDLPVGLPVGRFHLLADEQSLGIVVILFNPWAETDTVYMEDAESRNYYIKSAYERYFVGNVYQYPQLSVTGLTWMTNVNSILDDVLDLLEHSVTDWESCGDERFQMNFSDPVILSRAMTYMGASSAKHGLLVGRWDGKYDDGRAPGDWTSSKELFDAWRENGERPVKYGQCWVFGLSLTSMMRSLGIPARTLTNFNSAHDVPQGSMIDDNGRRIPNYDGVVTEDSADSVWNFHVWISVWFTRPDLDELGYGNGTHAAGWNDIDSTPQEASFDGRYHTGPANVADMKANMDGLYDNRFIMGEYNAYRPDWGTDYNGNDVGAITIGRLTLTGAMGEGSGCYPRGSKSFNYIYWLTSNNCVNDITGIAKPEEPSNLFFLPDGVISGSRRRETSDASLLSISVPDYISVGSDVVVTLNNTRAGLNMSKYTVDLLLESVEYSGNVLGVVSNLKYLKSRKEDTFMHVYTFDKYSTGLTGSPDFKVTATLRSVDDDVVPVAVVETRFDLQYEVPVLSIDDTNTAILYWTNPLLTPVNLVKFKVTDPVGKVHSATVTKINGGETRSVSFYLGCEHDDVLLASGSVTADSASLQHVHVIESVTHADDCKPAPPPLEDPEDVVRDAQCATASKQVVLSFLTTAMAVFGVLVG